MNNRYQTSVTFMNRFLIGVWLFFFSNLSQAVTIYYFPSDFNGNSQSPTEVSAQPMFSPICDGVPTTRLPGLDLVRAFAGVPPCPSTSGAGQLTEQVEYIFLVDDTNDLSTYLAEQLERQNTLKATPAGIKVTPSVLEFPSSEGREGFKILVVGEREYEQAGSDAQWLTQINRRFSENEVIAGTSSSEDDIFIAYHGSFYNKRMQLLENLSLEKIAQYFQSKQTQQSGGGGAGSPAPTSPPAAPPVTAPATTGRPMNDYMTMCSSNRNRVPLPPTWNPDSGDWTRVGVQETLFISANSTTEVWKYNSTSPAGLCIALPRMIGGSDIEQNVQLLGIICQSETTGKACFWDNVRRPTPEVSSGQADAVRRPGDSRDRYVGVDTVGLDPVNMRDGYNLAENCTNCHRGDNVFLIHPNTADAGDPPNSVLPMSGTSLSGSQYLPISGSPQSTNWVNPVIKLSQTEENAMSSCTSCHEIPALTVDYCGLLNSALGQTMPPSNPSAWNTATYRGAVNLMVDRCCVLGVNIKSRATSGSCLTKP